MCKTTKRVMVLTLIMCFLAVSFVQAGSLCCENMDKETTVNRRTGQEYIGTKMIDGVLHEGYREYRDTITLVVCMNCGYIWDQDIDRIYLSTNWYPVS